MRSSLAASWVFVSTLCLGGILNASAASRNPFFAMDTAIHGGTPGEQARMLKELGYDGIGTSGKPSEDFLGAFRSEGLKVYNTYINLSPDSAKPGLDPDLRALVPRLQPHSTDLWIVMNEVNRDGKRLAPSTAEGDELAVAALRELSQLCSSNRIRVALYPHTGTWVERVEDAVRVARKVNRPNVGVTFNLCHWLKVEGDREPRTTLREALPLLYYVTINGAEAGNTREMGWDKLIQPLDSGSYNIPALLKTLEELGYRGPIGFQGYGIRGDSREILRRTMNAWRRFHAEK